MADLWNYNGSDLAAGATGDILTVDGVERGQQRVLRRLLTNPGDYIWHPEYGAGLPARVGDTIDVDEITALIRSQIMLEAAVAKEPEPVVTVAPILNGMFVRIQYADAVTGQQVALAFDVNR